MSIYPTVSGSMLLPSPSSLPPPLPPPLPPLLTQHIVPPLAPLPRHEAARPPNLFTKQVEFDDCLSEATFKLHTLLFDDLSSFVDQQAMVVTLRVHVQEKRAILKRLREEVSRCDIEFITCVRDCVAAERSLDDPGIMAGFEAAQAARDLVGPVEADYEPLEVGLGAEEHKLKDMYAKLEVRLDQFFRLEADTSLQQHLPTEIEYEDSSEASAAFAVELEKPIEPRDIEPSHGAWIGEQVVVGQIPVRAEELIVETLQRRQSNMERPASSSEDFSKRKISSIAANEGDNDWLAEDLAGIAGSDEAEGIQVEDRPTIRDAMRQELSGLFSGMWSATAIESTALEDDLGSRPLFELNDTLLLSIIPPDHDNTLLDYLCAFGIKQAVLKEYLCHFENTRDRVNRWMLHRLRLSKRELFDLQREVTVAAPEVKEWVCMVLDEWSSDDLGQDQSYNYGSIEGDSSVNATQQIISPDLDEMAKKYPDSHGDKPSPFISNRAVVSTAPDVRSSKQPEGIE